MRRLLTSIICCWLLISGPAVAITAAQSDAASELIRSVNDYRAANGMPPLEAHNALMTAAQRQANYLAVNRIHSHQGEGGTMPQDRATAAGYPGLASENVASGTRGYISPAWAVEMWAGSYGHRITMLAPEVHLGVGVAENDEETFYILMVGSPSALAPEPPAGAAVSTGDNPPQPPPAVAAPILIATPREDGSIVHVVQAGQTAWAIAARYEVPLDALRTLNRLGPGAVLHPGDEIIIRLGEGQQAPPSSSLPTAHQVQSGETLWTIAAIYGLTLDELLALNGLARGAIIKPGDEVRIRAVEPTLTLSPAPTPAIPAATVTVPTLTHTHTPTKTPTVTPLPSPTVTPSLTLTPITVPFLTSGGQTDNADQAVAVGVGALVVVGLLIVLAGAAVMTRGRGNQG